MIESIIQLNIVCIIIVINMLPVVNFSKPREKPRIKRVGVEGTLKWMIANIKDVKVKINNLPFLFSK